MKRLAASFLFFALSLVAAEPAQGDWVKNSDSQTVFFAVLEGLYSDGVANEHVDLILPPNKDMTEHFVYACPICHPVVEALRVYRARPYFEFQKPKVWGNPENGFKYSYWDTLGREGLAPEIVARLSAPEKQIRLAAIEELVSKWVSRRLVMTSKDEEDYRVASQRMRDLSKQGEALLKRYQAELKGEGMAAYFERKKCPACEGASSPLFSMAVERPKAVAPIHEYRIVMPEIFFSVLEELYRAGVANEDLDAFISQDPNTRRTVFESHFVYACQLCHASWEAMRVYRQRPSFLGRKDDASNFGPGLSAELSAKLRSPDKTLRMVGIEQVVRTAVENKMNSLKLSVAERKAWSELIEAARERGLQLLTGYKANEQGDSMKNAYSNRKACPACDGSAGACKLELKPKAVKPLAPEF